MTAETEEVPEDFVDTSNVPPTLLVSVWTPPASESRPPAVPSRTLAVPSALVAEALA
ncbi:hypothetical protein [Lentzea sp. NPDC051838]|uniref:hypothetical protein n=1 Tax=Lentzea sp. NPDC051838 TaxID=3154849 RepID=UPI003417FC5E